MSSQRKRINWDVPDDQAGGEPSHSSTAANGLPTNLRLRKTLARSSADQSKADNYSSNVALRSPKIGNGLLDST